LDWGEILRLTVEKPFILIGLLAGLILLALAATSFKYWMKRLGKNWKRLHKTIYLASGLVVLHYAWAVKGSLANLSGDILRPLSMGLLVAILLVLRIPAVRRRLARAR
jgi:sulfoxide reductase heme-binding subunit YedZ